MENSRKTTGFLKECMADALLLLMEKKPFQKITVNEIAAAAGVNRSTWFRNFSSKSGALTFKLEHLWDLWCQDHGLAGQWRYTLSNASDFFRFTYSIRRILLTIYQAGIQSAVYDALYHIMIGRCAADVLERYQGRFYSYGLFGLLNEWLARDFRETPEEMTEMFLKIIEKR